MAGELFWLALSAALCLFIWIPYTALYAGLVGFRAGTTDLPAVDQLPAWAKRCHRAHMNLIETMIPFTALVLILTISGKADPSTATATMIFFFARVAHIVFYTTHTPYLRTPAFAVSSLVCLYLLWQILT